MKTCIYLLAFAIAAPSQAAILITTTGGYSVTGISDLVVNGVHYDVTLSRYNSFDSKYGTGDPPPVLPFFTSILSARLPQGTPFWRCLTLLQ